MHFLGDLGRVQAGGPLQESRSLATAWAGVTFGAFGALGLGDDLFFSTTNQGTGQSGVILGDAEFGQLVGVHLLKGSSTIEGLRLPVTLFSSRLINVPTAANGGAKDG